MAITYSFIETHFALRPIAFVLKISLSENQIDLYCRVVLFVYVVCSQCSSVSQWTFCVITVNNVCNKNNGDWNELCEWFWKIPRKILRVIFHSEKRRKLARTQRETRKKRNKALQQLILRKANVVTFKRFHDYRVSLEQRLFVIKEHALINLVFQGILSLSSAFCSSDVATAGWNFISILIGEHFEAHKTLQRRCLTLDFLLSEPSHKNNFHLPSADNTKHLPTWPSSPTKKPLFSLPSSSNIVMVLN